MILKIDTTQKHIQAQGFSLIEVTVVVALIGVIMAIALPAGRDLILQSRLTTQANTLVSDLLFARSEASSRSVNIVMCPTATADDGSVCAAVDAAWSINRFIFVDTNGNADKDAGEVRLKVSPPLPSNMTLVPTGFNSTTRIRFNNTGGLVPLGTSGSFKLCATGAATGRQISVGINGRPTTSRVACP